MKKLIIISDSHGNKKAIEELTKLFDDADYIIHLGDGEVDLLDLSPENKQKVVAVCGNCDRYAIYPNERVILVENVTILLTHGHLYGVKSGLLNLTCRAKELNARVVLYGHTHTANKVEDENVILINPGCISRYAFQKSYCFMTINGDKIDTFFNYNFFK